jgi:hypothetical protein
MKDYLFTSPYSRVIARAPKEVTREGRRMSSVVIVALFLITLGSVVTLLTMSAGLLSRDPRRDAVVPDPIAYDLEEVSTCSL